jgi:oxygen-independent coproporphyrinogen-3 oxidase
MGLRLKEGVDLSRYAALAGDGLPEHAISELEEIGMITSTSDRLTVTNQGFSVLNAVIAKLLGG